MFNAGFGCHHAGMLRADRNLVEKIFAQGYIKVTKTQLHVDFEPIKLNQM